ncbi:glucan endo-1,3-beta-glucosidase 8 [Ricinus communis]|uniref:glucan endo-1,3-beta-D-glucosidase n=1 Tax=Ricinus communis TaxID=3988 RepID=B9SW88_RICCO|nr:glucan endo-1,3-beta-glucosidase 8 [Ricinus communis]EEF32127.1 Glucan endo-1,3-beta-glucosidase precursor, putative [Ricinus communis]|eukprot:XP_002530257.1 glucan endo-1,3-beta-glucosidase 8 [Ricinus communis]
MAQACGLLLWGFCMVMVSTNVLSAVLPGIGVNWGNIASHPLPPDIVVKMLKDNNINRVKLFDADAWTVNALAGSGIEVMVAIPNNMLQYIADSVDNAKDWVKENVTEYLRGQGGVDIRYVAVGNEPFLASYNGSYDKTTFPALQNVQKALDEEGVGDKIKASVPLNADVYEGNLPSQGNFRKDVRDVMTKIVHHLHDHKAPFIVNIYPFISLYQSSSFPFEYAFFDGGGKKIQDKNVTYTNVFEANYDTLVWSLKKAGVPDLKILVGEVGWPTDGHVYANANLAKKFYDGLLKTLAAKKGTPLRPGVLDVYLFGLLDEDMKSNLPGNFERHWGIFRFDGRPKFAMDFSGQGNDKMLIEAKGVQYLPAKWCVLNKEVESKSMIPAEISYACSLADCSSLAYGSSCNKLDSDGNVSYAFNMYFQMNNQDVQACDFSGLATIVTQNASRGTCLFPIQIVSHGDRLMLGYWVTIFAGFVVLPFFI